VTHVISATYTRFDRMSPTAAALAVLLHLATALAVWWVSPLSHRTAEVEDRAIDVTIEQPAAAPPEAKAKPSPPPSAAKPPPPPKATPAPLGLAPPSPTIADTPKQAVPAPETQQLALPPPQQEPQPDPQKNPSPPQQQQALVPQEAAPSVPLERSLPPLEAPPPPLTSKDFPKAPRAQPPMRPQTHVAPPAAPHQQLRPSPLPSSPPRQAPADSQATAPSATFVNPADQYNQARVVDQYLWSVANKISQYRYHSNEANEQGTVVLRLVISRDGRLLDVSVARSSGMVNLDRGLIEAARAAAPYAPLPNALRGPQVAFTLPFASVYRRQ
jgi:TonB family protein